MAHQQEWSGKSNSKISLRANGNFISENVTKVSVIIPTYNRASTVLDSVRSALDQTYPCMEVIVIDDGSSDETAKLLEKYLGRITILHQSNAGPSVARNHGVRHASGDIFAFLDSDDVWMPDKIERQVSMMDSCGMDMSCCICNTLISNGLQNNDQDAFGIAAIRSEHERALWKNPGEVLASRFLLFNQAAAIRREAFVKVGGYNPRLRLLEDHELALRIAALGGTWGMISTPLVRKNNGTKGIGVVCCEDSLAHAKAQRVALTSVLESGLVRDEQMRRQLKRRISANAREIRNETMVAAGGLTGQSLGRLGRLLVRAESFIARRRFPKPVTEEHSDMSRQTS